MSNSLRWLLRLCGGGDAGRRRVSRAVKLSSGTRLEQFEERQMLSAHVAAAAKINPHKTPPNYAGHWDTSEGPMDITQNGKKITATVTPPTVGEVHGTAKLKGNGSIKGHVTFDLDGTTTIVKYTAHLDSNDPNKMEGSYDLTFVGITHYTYDFTATRTPPTK